MKAFNLFYIYNFISLFYLDYIKIVYIRAEKSSNLIVLYSIIYGSKTTI